MANNKIQLGDGTVLMDLTGDTVIPNKLARGYTAHNAAGQPITGTMDEGGSGGTDHDFLVTAEVDLDTWVLSNVSATLAEVVAAAEADKDVRLLAHADIDGVATIVFASPLVFAESISAYNYQTAMFQTRVVMGSDPVQVSISASSGDHNGEFVVNVVEDPEPAMATVSYISTLGSGYSVNNVVWGKGSAKNIRGLLMGDYPERLHMYLSDGTALHLSNVDTYNNVAVFIGRADGIKYTLEVVTVSDPQDIPSGAYYETVYDENDPSYYVVYRLDADFDGISYIYVDVNTTQPSSGNTSVPTEVTNVTLPNKFLEKITILGLKQQLKNLSVIEHFNGYLSLIDLIELDGFSFVRQTSDISFMKNAVVSALVPSFVSMVYFQIVPTQPQAGYYIEIPGGTYLTGAAETGMAVVST